MFNCMEAVQQNHDPYLDAVSVYFMGPKMAGAAFVSDDIRPGYHGCRMVSQAVHSRSIFGA